MKLDSLLREQTQTLQQAGIGTARLDALVLMEDVCGRDRAWLLAHPEHELSPGETAQLKKLITRRARHEPLAYVRGKTEFYGRDFIITPAVLEPRPESETMIDLLKALPDLPATARIADVGAGSGALGITAQLELPEAQVELLEIDPAALEVTQSNVDKFTLYLPCIAANLLCASSQPYAVLLCNLPYVPDNHAVNQAAAQEPRLAIFGGPDGLDVYRELFQQIDSGQGKPLYILSESLPPQHSPLAEIAKNSHYRQVDEADFIQVFRRVP